MNFPHTIEVKMNLNSEELLKFAIENKEVVLSADGVLCAYTGKRTGRSPKDRFIVQDSTTQDAVDWGLVNQATTEAAFTHLWNKSIRYLDGKTVYQSQLQVGADERFSLPIVLTTERAWHQLFMRNLLIFPAETDFKNQKPWSILSVPGLSTDPQQDSVHSDAALMIHFSEQKILLIGLEYAGELKKACFTVLNFLLPPQNVLPMHCAANQGSKGEVALFFGLSGTGKTTLSADPERLLIGDDEHGWSHDNVFNFEGGCYAKCIHLSQEREPMIWSAIRPGAIMENVVLRHGIPDFNDASYTENTRAAYPRSHIDARVLENKGKIPNTVIFLTCDLYGVLPPVSLLTSTQAAYYFLSGYTAHIGSTEVGQKTHSDISPTFSTCFGAPFFPRPPIEYAQLLLRRLKESGAQVYLVNTGWTGGSYGHGGTRFSIPVTRSIVRAILNGSLLSAPTEQLPLFHLKIPTYLSDEIPNVLNPRSVWTHGLEFDRAALILAQKFQENFKKFLNVPHDIASAGPA